jgi:hypothetical protein
LEKIFESLKVGILSPELFRNRVVSVGLGVVSRCSGTVVIGTSKPILAKGISVRRANLKQFKRAFGVEPRCPARISVDISELAGSEDRVPLVIGPLIPLDRF